MGCCSYLKVWKINKTCWKNIAGGLAFSTHSVSWSTVWKTACEGKLNIAWQEKVTECLWANWTKDHSRYTSIWYTCTLRLVNFGRFCQHSSITDADEIYDMATVRDLSTSDLVFKSVMCNMLKDFLQVDCLYEEHARIVWKVDNAIHRINHYPADSVVCFVNTYPLDSDLSCFTVTGHKCLATFHYSSAAKAFSFVFQLLYTSWVYLYNNRQKKWSLIAKTGS